MLTTSDGRQVLPVDEPVRRVDARPSPDPDLTRAVTTALGWSPDRTDDAHARLAAIDRAVDESLLRFRPMAAAVVVGLVLVLGWAVTVPAGMWVVLPLVVLAVAYTMGRRWSLEPIDEAVRRTGAAPARPLRTKVVEAIAALRWTSISGGGRGG